MKKLAEKANVSRTAVSMILNGKSNGHISLENQKKVLKLAKEYNFRPNVAARKLRTGKSSSIGIIMPVPNTTFYADMATLFQRKLSDRGHSALFSFFYSSEPSEIEKAFRSIIGHGISGIISWEYNECFLREKVPAVLYTYSEPARLYTDQVSPDFGLMVDQTISHFFEHGHTRIAVMGLLCDPRIELLNKKLAEQGVSIPADYFIDVLGPDNLLNSKVEQIVNSNPAPTAIICHDDLIAARIHSRLLSLGKNIPDDFSILCFNDSSILSVLTPTVSAFSLHEDELTDMLIQLLFARIDKPEAQSVTRMIAPELIIRKSTSKKAGYNGFAQNTLNLKK
jgi:DNA-binding LacI/PurR family transcriptional regulator